MEKYIIVRNKKMSSGKEHGEKVLSGDDSRRKFKSSVRKHDLKKIGCRRVKNF
jgi:hypothetical protein